MFRNVFFTIFTVVCLFAANAQFETTKWYFGGKAGLDFMTNPPTPLFNSAMWNSEGCSSIADAGGNLLFYTRGDSVWNQQHQMLANGFALFGNSSTSQSAVIVKKPGSANLYYIFTMAVAGSTLGLNYSVVDMSLAAGLGSVTVKNAALYTASCSEKLAATRHCNGLDVWVLVHENNSSNFRAYLLTAAGVSTTAVISSVGSSFSAGNYFGCMKFSANGKKLGVTLPPNYTSTNFANIELFDFNTSTGAVSNPLSLNLPYANNGVYDCEFSPNSSKLYSANSAGSQIKLYQWNLCAGSASAIAASQFTVTVSDTLFSTFQLAPNGKIYISRIGMPFLSVIHNPNALGALCNFAQMGVSIAPRTCGAGLPNFVSSLVKAPLSYTSDLSCTTVSFSPPSIGNPSLSGCVASGFTVTGQQWSFGEPLSGANNTSTLTNPVHTYSTAGNYLVKLVLNYSGCAPDTIRQIITVGATPTISINSASFTCNGLGTATASVLQAPGGGQYSYTWNPTGQTSSVITNLNAGNYTVNVMVVGGTCLATQTVAISLPTSSLQSVLSQTSACSTSSAQVNASGGSGTYNYLWTPGSQTNAILSGAVAGNYSVTITDVIKQCSITKTLQVSTYPVPTLAISGADKICIGLGATLTVSGANTYTWSNGATTNSISVTPSSTTVYTVSGTTTLNMCSSVKSLTLVVSQCLSIPTEVDNTDIHIFPNPANKILTIDSKMETHLNITNMLGQVVFEAKINVGTNQINTSTFNEGIYLLRLGSNSNYKIFKLIKKEGN
jgi:Secretion system C-terminal sorting domain